MNEDVQHLPDTLSAVDVPLEAAEEAGPSLGQLMIVARERWNLSAGDVARQLRLGLRQVEALEANRFDSLPGNTFVRGFIRNYAKVVQIDPAVFIEAYERSRPQLPSPEFVAPTERIDFTSKPTPKWVWYIGGTVAAGVLLPLLVYLALHDEELPAQPTPQAAASKTEMAQPGQVLETPLMLPQPPAVSPSQAPAPVMQGTIPTDVSPSLAALPGTSGSTTATGPSLKLNFEGDAWVEIRDKSGKKIFSQLNRAGSEQVVQGEPPLSLVVGDAAKVKITYNGNPVDLAPHIRKTVARLTLE